MEIELKYGCNSHQAPARLTVPGKSHFQVLNGRPSYINILDALGAWQLARELKAATGKPGLPHSNTPVPQGLLFQDPFRIYTAHRNSFRRAFFRLLQARTSEPEVGIGCAPLAM